MPFDGNKFGSAVRIGSASGNWKQNEKTYEHVQGILIDVKHLMKVGVRSDVDEISRLAQLINN